MSDIKTNKYAERNQEEASSGYVILARVIIFSAFLMFVLNVLLVLSIMTLTPMLKVEPVLMNNTSNSGNVVIYDPFYLKSMFLGEKNMPENDMLFRDEVITTFIERYISLRNTIIGDKKDMEKVWGAKTDFFALSHPYVYYTFEKFKEEDPELKKILEQRSSVRSVMIKKIERIQPNSVLSWKAEFVTYDVNQFNPEPVEKEWVASIKINTARSRISFGKFNNPIGFIITHYYQAPKDVGIAP